MWKLRRHKIKESQRELKATDERAEDIQARWPEVTELSTWARTTRENNHLTELFLQGRRSV